MLDELADAVEDWLTTSPIQIQQGKEQGAIAGWVDDYGAPAYAYQEISGYYLTAMASIVHGAPAERGYRALERARLVINWLATYMHAGQLPATRIYLQDNAPDDWRNHLTFSFDVAMVLRGLIAIRDHIKDSSVDNLINFYRKEFQRFALPGQALLSHIQRRDSDEHKIPMRWSTQPGPHHVKAISCLFLKDSVSGEPAFANALNDSTVAKWLPLHQDQLFALGLHPTLYYIEGLIQIGLLSDQSILLEAAAQTYWTIIAQLPGEVPPENLQSEPLRFRSDVIAQCLRMGSLLVSMNLIEGQAIERILSACRVGLHKFIRTDGAVAFQIPGHGECSQWNSWCAMFSLQALRFDDCIQAKMKINYTEALLLI
jgi:hypothetical protein